jgi:pSer/pThr/pTyr-binding forkhead associated (FHA) protein
VGQSEKPLVIEIASQAVLGRYAAGSASQPRIDLAPYNAFGKGVSRMHAIIRRTERGLVVEDLASSNGSWLNGVRLNPFSPRPLQSGDRLALSQLEIVVHFKAEQAAAAYGAE